MPTEEAQPIMKEIAAWAAEWCVGCSDQPRFIAPKVLECMVAAHGKGEDPIAAMNHFLGTAFTPSQLPQLGN